jgi:hypothetical protein
MGANFEKSYLGRFWTDFDPESRGKNNQLGARRVTNFVLSAIASREL